MSFPNLWACFFRIKLFPRTFILPVLPHLNAVFVCVCFREELRQFMENLGCPPPGTNQLTTYLSKPFTRLDRYPSLLKELERHIEVRPYDLEQ